MPGPTFPGSVAVCVPLDGRAESGTSASKAVGGGHLLGNQTACQLSFPCLHPSADILISTERGLAINSFNLQSCASLKMKRRASGHVLREGNLVWSL